MTKAMASLPDNNHLNIDCKNAKIFVPATAEGIMLAEHSLDHLLAEVRRHRRGGIFAAVFATVGSVAIVAGAALLAWFKGGREALMTSITRL